MPTKVVRLPLISNDTALDYKRINEELWKIQRNVRSAKNKIIQLLWEWNNYGHEYSKENGIYPKVGDVLPLKTISGNIYAFLKEQYPDMYALNLSTIIRSTEKDFKNSISDVLKGTRSIIEYKDNAPIEIHNDGILLYFDGTHNSYSCRLSVFSGPYSKTLCLSSTAILFKIILRDKAQTEIVNRCISGEYKISASKLIYVKKKKQWFFNLSYSFEAIKDDTILDENIMGVDVGVKCAAVMSFNCCEDRYYIDGGEISAFRHKTEKQKRELQRQGKYCGEGRIGHGVKTRIKPLERLNEVIGNFRDTINHKYSKYIIDMAVKHKCGTIQIEDLKNIAGDDKFLKEWTYFDLRTKIEYKAKEKGINVIAIDPKYTSQRCSKCGHIDSMNRPKEEMGQAYFKCTNCGFEANADYNASQNIATKDIEKIIQKATDNMK